MYSIIALTYGNLFLKKGAFTSSAANVYPIPSRQQALLNIEHGISRARTLGLEQSLTPSRWPLSYQKFSGDLPGCTETSKAPPAQFSIKDVPTVVAHLMPPSTPSISKYPVPYPLSSRPVPSESVEPLTCSHHSLDDRENTVGMRRNGHHIRKEGMHTLERAPRREIDAKIRKYHVLGLTIVGHIFLANLFSSVKWLP